MTKSLFRCFRPRQWKVAVAARLSAPNNQHYSYYYYSKHRRTCTCQQRHIASIPGFATATSKTHRHTHQATLNRIHPEHLYQIINDVDKYHQFLPYCTESKVLQSSPCGTMYDAVLRVGLPGLSALSSSSSSLVEERYISRVRMMSPSVVDNDLVDDSGMPMIWTVEAKSIQSKLFDSLKSRWELTLVNTEHNIHDMGIPNPNDTARIRHNSSSSSSCSVQFEVEIQVSNPLVSLMLDQVLKDVARKQVDAFERRGNEVPFRRRREL